MGTAWMNQAGVAAPIIGIEGAPGASFQTQEGTNADRLLLLLDGTQGVWRTTDGNGTWIDVDGTWRRLITDEGGEVGAGVPVIFQGDGGDSQIRSEAGTGWQVLRLMGDDTIGAGIDIFGGGETHNGWAESMRFYAGGGNLKAGIDADGLHSTTMREVFDRHAHGGNIGAGTTNLPFNSYPSLSYTATASLTLAFTWPSMTTEQLFTASLALVMSGGAWTITWPAEVAWAGGTAPTLIANGVERFIFTRLYANGSWRTHGTYVGRF